MFVIAGPCVIESESSALAIAEQLAAIAARLNVRLIYKASFDKANRSSPASPRGPGLAAGLAILARIKQATGLELLTDVHETAQVEAAAEVVDVLQIPAFLSRQTDLIIAAARTGRIVHVKKGQFMAPADMRHVVAKAAGALPGGAAVGDRLWLCERGTTFGYRDLIVDMRGLEEMAELGCPVVYDASHSVQQPGAAGQTSGGQRQRIPVLARAAVAAGIDGLFIETHPDPDRAHSDSATVWPLDRLEDLLRALLAIKAVADPLRGMAI